MTCVQNTKPSVIKPSNGVLPRYICGVSLDTGDANVRIGFTSTQTIENI